MPCSLTASFVTEHAGKEQDSFGTVIRCPYRPNLSNRLLLKHGTNKFRFLRKTISAWYEIMQFYARTGPKLPIYLEAYNYIKNNKVDIILATGEPFVLFHYAKKLGQQFNLPWVADYRDPWSPNLRKSPWIYHWFQRSIERRTVNNAQGISTVSPFVAHQIQSVGIFPEIAIIPNGFDHEAMDQVRQVTQNASTFSIPFVGTLYDWHPWKRVLATLNQWKEMNPERAFFLSFYGTNRNEEIMNEVRATFPRLEEYVKVYAKLPNKDLLQQLASYNALLLFNYYAFMGTKIYDYLGLKRLILFCFTHDPEANALKQQHYPLEVGADFSETLQEDVLRETNAGIILKDADHLLETLTTLFEEHAASGAIKCDSIHVEQYARSFQTKKMADFLLKLHHSPAEIA
ncbi:MAG: hypothetical protein EBR54_08865 [Flavobacteriia bacterium]|nr:hypothetical protein [Flavobacteriia bacterium]